MNVVLEILFLILSNANIEFNKKKVTWRSYIAAEALLITKRVEIIDKKAFAKTALDKNIETFVKHVTFLSLSRSTMLI